MTPKIKFFIFGLEQKLDYYFCVEFHGDSNNDGFKLYAVESIIEGVPGNFKRARICKPAMAFVTDLGAGKHPSPLGKKKKKEKKKTHTHKQIVLIITQQ